MVFADASFESNIDCTSQVGWLIATTVKHGKTDVIKFSSTTSRRVTRSVLAAEIFAMTIAFDATSTFKITVEELYMRKVEMVLCTDSKCLFDLLIGIKSPTKKMLLIDLKG